MNSPDGLAGTRGHGIPCLFKRMANLGVLGVALWVAPHAGAQVPSVDRGRGLYENHCVACHTSKVHTRVNRLPMSQAELREIVNRWQNVEKLMWNSQDVDDVVAFLNRTQYQFP
jgi:hypothetical protein